MIYRENNEFGSIAIGEEVLVRIAAEEVRKRPEEMRLCNAKGKVPAIEKHLIRLDWSDCIFAQMEGGELCLQVNVLLRFGISISNTGNMLIAEIRREIERQTGILAKNITLYIRGLIINDMITRRHLVIRG
jgi:uncharacterized alkaline shock family protein YloU